MTTCKNCDTTFEGKYCPNCTQKAETHRFTLKHFIHDFLHALTHTDKGILLLMKELFLRPGLVALEYNGGKRKKYFNPITFLLIATAVQLYAAKNTGIFESYFDATQKLVQDIADKVPEVNDTDAVQTLKEAREQNTKALENGKIITFLFIPVLAFFTWLLFKKSKHNYAENLVFATLVQGQISVYFILVCIVPFLIYPGSILVVMYLYLVVVMGYNFIACLQFFKQRWWVTLIKTLIIQLAYFQLSRHLTYAIFNYL